MKENKPKRRRKTDWDKPSKRKLLELYQRIDALQDISEVAREFSERFDRA